MRPDCNYLC